MFKNTQILLGVTGGIAAYKAAELLRALVKQSAVVRVMMTEAACKFVTPLTFETLSGHPVLTELFADSSGFGTVHIDWARWPQLIVICPATANTVAKIAHGVADNALTTTVLASKAPVIFCPAMNKEMFLNPIYQENQQKLLKLGYRFVMPAQGELACGEIGWGRLADLPDILDAVKIALATHKDLDGSRILITAGPTHEPLDPVRYLSNRSSGKMGFALAERATLRGAQVTLITGPTDLRPFAGQVIRVQTAAEMEQAVFEHLPQQDVLIMAAAVADYTPAHPAPHKIKKSTEEFDLRLRRTQDILATCANHKGHRIHVGFSLETHDEVEHALKKMHQKNLDLIVVNNPLQEGAGFAVDTNVVTIIDKQGRCEHVSKRSKIEIADIILDKVAELIAKEN